MTDIEFISDYNQKFNQAFVDINLKNIENLIIKVKQRFEEGNKVLIGGNGGSFCIAQHFAEDCFKVIRSSISKPIKCIALGSNPGQLTCISNDLGYDSVFSYEIETLGNAGDLFIGLSVSGNSHNIVKAIDTAKKEGIETIVITGFNGNNKCGRNAHHVIAINSENFGVVEDLFQHLLHMVVYRLCEKQ